MIIGTGQKLQRITIGSDVQSIGDYIFCIYDFLYDRIDTVECLASTPPVITENCFWSHTYNNATLCVPKNLLNRYSKAEGWKEFVNITEGSHSGPSVFYHGDVNCDGKINIEDVTELIDLLLSGNTTLTVGADVNEDGRVNIEDVTTLIDMLLRVN